MDPAGTDAGRGLWIRRQPGAARGRTPGPGGRLPERRSRVRVSRRHRSGQTAQRPPPMECPNRRRRRRRRGSGSAWSDGTPGHGAARAPQARMPRTARCRPTRMRAPTDSRFGGPLIRYYRGRDGLRNRRRSNDGVVIVPRRRRSAARRPIPVAPPRRGGSECRRGRTRRARAIRGRRVPAGDAPDRTSAGARAARRRAR
jgi:hypothetical protein